MKTIRMFRAVARGLFRIAAQKVIALCFTFAIVLSLVGTAMAEPKYPAQVPPKGTLVSAVVYDDGKATISVSGPINLVAIHHYNWSTVEVYNGKSSITINLRDSPRFQITFSDEKGIERYSFIEKAMETDPPDWFGPGVGAKCSYNPQAKREDCVLIVKQ
ncbi:hypothetical protein EPO05_04850 [Patescibacteria group bacterium]|nr:MAG: hypothetical protein EPO05_04850 [Patescibacteria group bacterium]